MHFLTMLFPATVFRILHVVKVDKRLIKKIYFVAVKHKNMLPIRYSLKYEEKYLGKNGTVMWTITASLNIEETVCCQTF